MRGTTTHSSEQKIPLRHRQHGRRLAGQRHAVGGHRLRSGSTSIAGVASLWIMSFFEILRVFSTATSDFDRPSAWTAGLCSPARETNVIARFSPPAKLPNIGRESVLSGNRDLAARELSGKLLAALRSWQPASIAQQDDITLVVVDAV